MTWFPESAVADVQEFEAAKKVRDQLAHGQLEGDASFPVQAVRSLLGRYLATAVREHLT
jgi:hypothetical protein